MSSVPSRPIGEFDLIRRYFTRPFPRHDMTVLGIGDDCAVLRWAGGDELAVTTDTLVAGVHFLSDVEPYDLGYKALAVNLSDLAACAAEPVCVTLCLTVPAPEPSWLEGFSAGFFDLASVFGVELIGGDTTRGPLSVTVQAIGRVPAGAALRRSGARVGDVIYISGPLGSAGLGLKVVSAQVCCDDPEPAARLLRPEPRVATGCALRGIATAGIDISDGLAGDLGHILAASGVGAVIEWERLPLSPAVSRYVAETGDWSMPLMAGDDYELCFTVPESRRSEIEGRLSAAGLPCHAIGGIEAGQGLRMLREGRLQDLPICGFDHFTGV